MPTGSSEILVSEIMFDVVGVQKMFPVGIRIPDNPTPSIAKIPPPPPPIDQKLCYSLFSWWVIMASPRLVCCELLPFSDEQCLKP